MKIHYRIEFPNECLEDVHDCPCIPLRGAPVSEYFWNYRTYGCMACWVTGQSHNLPGTTQFDHPRNVRVFIGTYEHDDDHYRLVMAVCQVLARGHKTKAAELVGQRISQMA